MTKCDSGYVFIEYALLHRNSFIPLYGVTAWQLGVGKYPTIQLPFRFLLSMHLPHEALQYILLHSITIIIDHSYHPCLHSCPYIRSSPRQCRPVVSNDGIHWNISSGHDWRPGWCWCCSWSRHQGQSQSPHRWLMVDLLHVVIDWSNSDTTDVIP